MSLLASTYLPLSISKLLASETIETNQNSVVEPSSLTDTLNTLFPGKEISASDEISLKLPHSVANGSAVSISVSSSLVGVSQIHLLVAKNPVPLVASFALSPAMAAHISTRIKVAETSYIIAVVNAQGQLFKARQEVIVTQGSCGA